MEINRTTDAFGRDTGFSLAGSDYAVTYGFDAYGRFHSVSSSVQSARSVAAYTYLPGADLVSGMSASSGFLWSRAYESVRSLITAVENSFGETVISRYDYENDALGRRTARADSGLAFANPAFDAYAYNERSEVIGAQRYHGTDISDTSTVYGGRQFGYAYDPIGNRISASETIGGETLAKAYTANALNQYTAIANPDAVGLRGDATNSVVVTVNGEAVHSDDVESDIIPWHFALDADNAGGPDFPLAEIVAVVNPPGTNTSDIVSTSSGHLYAPPQNETLTYDLDGNLVSDGRWQYTWNGENRLIKAEELVSPTNRQPYMVDYAYDHRGRMVWNQISINSVAISSRTLLWDGYNIVQALTHSQTHTLTNSFLWGLDLSGTLQGAGGIGGLLAEVQDGTPYFSAFDANGNVTEYVSTNGITVAHYDYSPFGEIVAQSGELADVFNHRFSTKPWCGVTGLNEYLFRKYGSFLARWLSRDLIAERGGLNLYGYVGNAPLVRFDRLGLSWLVCDKCERGRIRYAGPAAYTLVSVAYPGFPNAVDAANSALASSELLNHIMLFANVAAGVAAEAVLAEVAKAVADWAIGYSMNWGWTAEMSAEVAAIKKKLGEATGVNVAVKVRWQKCETTFTPGLKGLTTRLDWVDKSEWYTYEDPSADGSTLPGSFGPNDMDAIMKALPAAFAEANEEVVK